MRPLRPSAVSILLVLLAACGDPPPPLLVHASDPHLLDPSRPNDEPQNYLNFARMMDTLRKGAAGRPGPRVLVVTGDFGLEAADPRYTPKGPLLDGPPSLSDSVRARRRLEEAVNIVAGEINGSPFRIVYFVPGNNDVLLENAEVSAWQEIREFTAGVQSRIGGREFIDLTACYHRPDVGPSACIARLDSPYVLVGFPTVSFKNAALKPNEYRPGPDSLPLAEANARRVHTQDTLHLEMLRRLREVLSQATAGGWQAVVLTHIADLEDPYPVSQRDSGKPLPASMRFSPVDRDDAWNASPTVFAQWKALTGSPRVAAILAGHFHDSQPRTYYQRYAWSDKPGRARPVQRVDRCRIFVAPPLAMKNQQGPGAGARGFTVVTLHPGRITRRLYWFGGAAEVAKADSLRDECAPPVPRRQAFTLSPAASSAHTQSFTIALLSALLALALWFTGSLAAARTYQRYLARALTAALRSRRARTFLAGMFGGSTTAVTIDAVVNTTQMIVFGLVWFAILFSVMLAAVFLVRRRPRA